MAGNKNKACVGLPGAAAAVALAAGSAASLGQAVITFTGSCGNDWTSTCSPGTSWTSSPLYPSGQDHAVIPAGAGTVTVCGGSPSVRSLDCASALNVCSGRSVSGYEDSRINNLNVAPGGAAGAGGGHLLLEGTGSIAGGVSGYPVINAGAYSFSGTSSFGPFELRNEGTLDINVTALNAFPVAPVLTNAPGATLELHAGNLFVRLVNQGALDKWSAGGVSIQGLARFEAGSLDIIQGSMALAGGSSWTGGTANLAHGTSLLLIPPFSPIYTHEWDGIASIDGEGRMDIITRPDKPLIIRQNMVLNLLGDGSVRLVNMPPEPGVVQIGDATVTNNGSVDWISASLERLPGTTAGLMKNSGYLTITNTTAGVKCGVDLENTWWMEQYADLHLTSGAKFTNSGHLDLKHGDISGDPGARMVCDNEIVRPADSLPGVSTISVPLDLGIDGSIDLPEGGPASANLVLEGGGEWSSGVTVRVATYDGYLPREVRLADGVYTLYGTGHKFSGEGSVRLDGVVEVGPGAELEMHMTEFEFLNYGTLNGPGLTRNTGKAACSGGAIGQGGDGNFENAGELTFGPLLNSFVSGTLRNLSGGTARQEYGVLIEHGLVENAGTWEIKAGPLAIASSATFRNTGILCGTDEAAVHGHFDNQGKVEVKAGSVLTFGGPIVQFANGTLAGGNWVVEQGGQLVLPGGLTTIGPGTVMAVNGSTFPAITGVEAVSGGEITFTANTAMNTPVGALKIENGGEVVIGNGVTLTVPLTIYIEPSLAGMSALKGEYLGSYGMSESFVVTPHLFNNGAVVPGEENHPGILDLTGEYEQGPFGTLFIELGGYTPGVHNDKLEVSGVAMLGGILKVAFIDNYTPPIGSEFQILTAGAISGTFGAVDLPVLPPNRDWQVVYAPGQVLLRVVGACYPDCNENGSLSVADMGCFQTKFVLGDPYADCNTDGNHTVADFGCFQTKFVVGCP